MEVDSQNTDANNNSQQRLKQPLFHFGPLQDNQVLISRKKHPRIYLERIHKIFFNLSINECYLQAVGASIQTAVDIALQVQEKYASITMEVDTFTMPIVDEIVDGESAAAQEVVRTESRLNSGILIKLLRKAD